MIVKVIFAKSGKDFTKTELEYLKDYKLSKVQSEDNVQYTTEVSNISELFSSITRFGYKNKLILNEEDGKKICIMEIYK